MTATPALKRVISNAAALAIGGVVAQIAFVTLEAVIARQLGLRAYGIFSSIYVYVLILVHVLDLGANWRMLKEGARDPSTLVSNFGTVLAIKVCAFLLAYPIVLVTLSVFGREPEVTRLFAIFAFFGLAMMIQDVVATVFNSLQRMTVNAVFQAAVPLAMLLVVLLLHSSSSLLRVVLACVGGTWLVTIAWFVITVRTVRPQIPRSGFLRYLAGGYHYGVTTTVNNIYLRVGVVLLSILKTPAEVGIFAAAFKLLELGYKIPTLAMRAVAPKLFADSTNDVPKFRREIDLLMRVTIVFASVVAIVLFAVGPSLVVLIFGPAFERSGQLAQIIGLALALKSVALMAQTVLFTADEHRYCMQADVATLVLAGAVAVPLISLHGALGAAIAVAFGDLIWASLMVSRLNRHMPGTRTAALVAAPILGLGTALALERLVHGYAVVESVGGIALLSLVLLVGGYLRPIMDFTGELRPRR